MSTPPHLTPTRSPSASAAGAWDGNPSAGQLPPPCSPQRILSPPPDALSILFPRGRSVSTPAAASPTGSAAAVSRAISPPPPPPRGSSGRSRSVASEARAHEAYLSEEVRKRSAFAEGLELAEGRVAQQMAALEAVNLELRHAEAEKARRGKELAQLTNDVNSQRIALKKLRLEEESARQRGADASRAESALRQLQFRLDEERETRLAAERQVHNAAVTLDNLICANEELQAALRCNAPFPGDASSLQSDAQRQMTDEINILQRCLTEVAAQRDAARHFSASAASDPPLRHTTPSDAPAAVHIEALQGRVHELEALLAETQQQQDKQHRSASQPSDAETEPPSGPGRYTEEALTRALAEEKKTSAAFSEALRTERTVRAAAEERATELEHRAAVLSDERDRALRGADLAVEQREGQLRDAVRREQQKASDAEGRLRQGAADLSVAEDAMRQAYLKEREQREALQAQLDALRASASSDAEGRLRQGTADPSGQAYLKEREQREALQAQLDALRASSDADLRKLRSESLRDIEAAVAAAATPAGDEPHPHSTTAAADAIAEHRKALAAEEARRKALEDEVYDLKRQAILRQASAGGGDGGGADMLQMLQREVEEERRARRRCEEDLEAALALRAGGGVGEDSCSSGSVGSGGSGSGVLPPSAALLRRMQGEERLRRRAAEDEERDERLRNGAAHLRVAATAGGGGAAPGAPSATATATASALPGLEAQLLREQLHEEGARRRRLEAEVDSLRAAGAGGGGAPPDAAAAATAAVLQAEVRQLREDALRAQREHLADIERLAGGQDGTAEASALRDALRDRDGEIARLRAAAAAATPTAHTHGVAILHAGTPVAAAAVPDALLERQDARLREVQSQLEALSSAAEAERRERDAARQDLALAQAALHRPLSEAETEARAALENERRLRTAAEDEAGRLRAELTLARAASAPGEAAMHERELLQREVERLRAALAEAEEAVRQLQQQQQQGPSSGSAAERLLIEKQKALVEDLVTQNAELRGAVEDAMLQQQQQQGQGPAVPAAELAAALSRLREEEARRGMLEAQLALMASKAEEERRSAAASQQDQQQQQQSPDVAKLFSELHTRLREEEARRGVAEAQLATLSEENQKLQQQGPSPDVAKLFSELHTRLREEEARRGELEGELRAAQQQQQQQQGGEGGGAGSLPQEEKDAAAARALEETLSELRQQREASEADREAAHELRSALLEEQKRRSVAEEELQQHKAFFDSPRREQGIRSIVQQNAELKEEVQQGLLRIAQLQASCGSPAPPTPLSAVSPSPARSADEGRPDALSPSSTPGAGKAKQQQQQQQHSKPPSSLCSTSPCGGVEDALASKERELQAERARSRALQERLRDLRGLKKSAAEERRGLEAEVRKLEDALAAARSQLARCRESVSRGQGVARRSAEQASQVADLEERNLALQRELREARKQLRGAKEEARTAVRERNAAFEETSHVEEQLQCVHETLLEGDGRIEELSAYLEEAETAKQRAEADMVGLQRALSEAADTVQLTNRHLRDSQELSPVIAVAPRGGGGVARRSRTPHPPSPVIDSAFVSPPREIPGGGLLEVTFQDAVTDEVHSFSRSEWLPGALQYTSNGKARPPTRRLCYEQGRGRVRFVDTGRAVDLPQEGRGCLVAQLRQLADMAGVPHNFAPPSTVNVSPALETTYH